jgi:DNA modification methylase
MPVIDQKITDRFAAYNSDCMEVLPTLPERSVDLSVYSPPFPELYQYSNDPRDMSNCTGYQEALDQYRFVVEQVARVTRAGRMSCVHCTDLKRGAFQRDFPGDIVRIHEESGFHFFCRITIWKDPWHFARRTRMLSLRHKQIIEDSSLCRIAPPDYLLVFRRPGDNAVPITHEHGFNSYIGETPMPPDLVKKYGDFKGDQRVNLLSHWIWRQYASPVWMDIRRKRLLAFRDAKECPEEKHVCPLQLDVIERCLVLWSNPGEVLLTPFMGIGSEVYSALVQGRRGIGIELKPSYYRQAVRMLDAAVLQGRGGCETIEADPDGDDESDDEASEQEPA